MFTNGVHLKAALLFGLEGAQLAVESGIHATLMVSMATQVFFIFVFPTTLVTRKLVISRICKLKI